MHQQCELNAVNSTWQDASNFIFNEAPAMSIECSKAVYDQVLSYKIMVMVIKTCGSGLKRIDLWCKYLSGRVRGANRIIEGSREACRIIPTVMKVWPGHLQQEVRMAFKRNIFFARVSLTPFSAAVLEGAPQCCQRFLQRNGHHAAKPTFTIFAQVEEE